MEKYACGYIIHFTEGPDEERILHIGSKSECLELVETIPALNYSGNRTPKSCETVIVQVREVSDEI